MLLKLSGNNKNIVSNTHTCEVLVENFLNVLGFLQLIAVTDRSQTLLFVFLTIFTKNTQKALKLDLGINLCMISVFLLKSGIFVHKIWVWFYRFRIELEADGTYSALRVISCTASKSAKLSDPKAVTALLLRNR